MEDISFLWNIVAILVAGGAVYGAIRADIRWIHESTKSAHERIDKILLDRNHN